MAERSPSNLNAFGHFNGIGGEISIYTIDGGATLADETNPGETMDFITRKIEESATIVAVGAEDGAGGFRIMLQGGTWDAGTLQTALRAFGATVGTNNYDLSGATVAAYTF
jgi:hypothetical protein|tara:strand:- start:228 stop:560 length:333 start_codon:yes stop_codon:yes gene_type:complete